MTVALRSRHVHDNVFHLLPHSYSTHCQTHSQLRLGLIVPNDWECAFFRYPIRKISPHTLPIEILARVHGTVLELGLLPN